jgi:hypothetical protein
VLYRPGQHKLIFTNEKNRKSKTKFCCSYGQSVGPGEITIIIIIIIIIIIMIFRKWEVGIWTGSSWLRIGTGGGYL